MGKKDIKWCPQHGYPLPCNKCGLGQYEAGEQAGRREAMAWVASHSQIEKCDPAVMAYFCDYRWIDESDWQDKLREWGNSVESIELEEGTND